MRRTELLLKLSISILFSIMIVVLFFNSLTFGVAIPTQQCFLHVLMTVQLFNLFFNLTVD